MDLDYLNNPEFQELIRKYLDHLHESLSNLQANWSNKNYTDLQQFGHNIKGSGRPYGFQDFSDLGKQIEDAAKEQDGTTLETLIEQFESVLNQERKKYCT